MPYPNDWPTPYPSDDDGQGRPPTVAALVFCVICGILAGFMWLAIQAAG